MQIIDQKEKECIDSIKETYDYLFRWGHECSTYKLHKYHPFTYDKETEETTFIPESYLFYVLNAERMASIQWVRNMSNSVYINNVKHTWDNACKILLPDWRKKYIEYVSLKKYYEELPSRDNVIMGILLSSERIDAFRNFGWKISLYLRRSPKDYENKLREIYYEQSKKMWLSVCPNINYEDHIKIS
jgi:hypothetical protein